MNLFVYVGVTANEVLDIHVESEDGEGGNVQSNALHEGQNALSQDIQLIRKESWDLEREFAKMKAMDLQQRLSMQQVKKEQKVLESVRRDLKYFQETLKPHVGGKVEKKQHKLRESLLPPPPPPSRKKTKQHQRQTKTNWQTLMIINLLTSSLMKWRLLDP